MAYDAEREPDEQREGEAERGFEAPLAESGGSAGARPVRLTKGGSVPPEPPRPGAEDTPRDLPIAEQPTLAAQPLPPGVHGSHKAPDVPPVPLAPGPPPGADGLASAPGGHGPYSPPSGPHAQPHVPPGHGTQPPPYVQPHPYQPQGPYPQPGLYHQPGYGIPPGAGWMRPQPPPTSGICTAALVVGIISGVMTISLYGLVLTWILGPVALGLGISARRKVARGEAHGSGSATAGFVLGIVTTAVSWLLLALMLIGLAAE